MSESISTSESYFALIDEIADNTLKGKIKAKEQVYRLLVRSVSAGTGEIFERCLQQRLGETQLRVNEASDELKQAKAQRVLRALQMVVGEWERLVKENQGKETIATVVAQVVAAPSDSQIVALLRAIDPNRDRVLDLPELLELARCFQGEAAAEIKGLGDGIIEGIGSWQRLEPYLVTWIYDKASGRLGFGEGPEDNGPWALWAKQVSSAFSRSLFNAIARNQEIAELARQQVTISPCTLVELALILQLLQRGLVAWFEQQAYNTKAGVKLAASTFISFAVIWSQLARGFAGNQAYADACFHMTLQSLRAFARREYFPMYGGIFASFSGEYLRFALDYLDEPLRRWEGSPEKARIMTIIGYSLRASGQSQKAIFFHEQAVEIARQEQDTRCEIANLNHLSRTYVALQNYAEAIAASQRALILSRQTGDRTGEACALSNFGYSQVFQARHEEIIEAEVYEEAVNYLQQGLVLAEKLGDTQSQALAATSLGIACVILERLSESITYLNKGVETAGFTGDLYLLGINYAYLAQAYYRAASFDQTIFPGCLGMYLLAQIGSEEWRQPAGLLVILQGQMAEDVFHSILEQKRWEITAVIGVEGYEFIPEQIAEYKRSMS
ncbi:MAG TPA: tetratricopeptide repeat protein [Oscillatoriaceae cyanobacterium M33_DOE_052]|uniref:Tetratricopeptide repeat protein n=1 Tax=Planktothricoides sp. SpSt-374 TaxID=2282167 RepID=A0A7C3VMT3_9CYAN|nr:tetratricopeptide repeat protein [Oscillatoriaceae cyanobacterium M33_DOE_052]